MKGIKIVTILALVWIISGLIVVHKAELGDYSKVNILGKGTITLKRKEDYSCGKHGRYTCTGYYFNIEDKIYEVDKEVFDSNIVGNTYTITERVDDLPWYAPILIAGSIFFMVAAPILIGVILAECTIAEDKKQS